MRRPEYCDLSGLSLFAGGFVLGMEGLERLPQWEMILRDDFAGLRGAFGRQRVSAEVADDPIDGELTERINRCLGVGDIFVVQMGPAFQQIDAPCAE